MLKQKETQNLEMNWQTNMIPDKLLWLKKTPNTFSAFITKFCKPIKNHESIDARLPPKSLPLFLPGRCLATGPGGAGEGGGGRRGRSTCRGWAAA